MTSNIRQRSSNGSPAAARARGRRAFTLTELVVVIGIMILILSIAVPMVARAWRQGDRTRTAADLQAIASALEAYKADQGDYPRVPEMNTGAAVLFKALVGPGPAGPVGSNFYAQPPRSGEGDYRAGDAARAGNAEYVCISDTPTQPPTPLYWVKFSFFDGQDGLGFRGRQGGKSYPAYLQPERFMAGRNRAPGAFRDRYAKAILYFPAATTRPNINVVGQGTSGPTSVPGYIHSDPTPTGTDSKHSLYDADDNIGSLGRGDNALALKKMRLMLGDKNMNGIIDAGETAVYTGPYLLWSCGPDEQYGPSPETASPANTLDDRDAAKCDDVTNFRP